MRLKLVSLNVIKGNVYLYDYSNADVAFIEDWMNTIPRRILKYKTPKELFEAQLDIIYQHK